MIIEKQKLQILAELLAILDEKNVSDDGINENEEGMRDILIAVVTEEYGYIREILQDYKG